MSLQQYPAGAKSALYTADGMGSDNAGRHLTGISGDRLFETWSRMATDLIFFDMNFYDNFYEDLLFRIVTGPGGRVQDMTKTRRGHFSLSERHEARCWTGP